MDLDLHIAAVNGQLPVTVKILYGKEMKMKIRSDNDIEISVNEEVNRWCAEIIIVYADGHEGIQTFYADSYADLLSQIDYTLWEFEAF